MTEHIGALSESAENYLKTIGRLCQEHGHAHVVDISRALNVKKPSVTAALSLLRDVGLIEYKTYTPVTLTEKGQQYSDQLRAKAMTITSFVIDCGGVDEKRAAEAACLLEHWINDDEISILQSMLKKEES